MLSGIFGWTDREPLVEAQLAKRWRVPEAVVSLAQDEEIPTRRWQEI